MRMWSFIRIRKSRPSVRIVLRNVLRKVEEKLTCFLVNKIKLKRLYYRGEIENFKSLLIHLTPNEYYVYKLVLRTKLKRILIL